MENPYEKPVKDDQVELRSFQLRAASWAFALLLAGPVILELDEWTKPDPAMASADSLREKLAAFEKRFESLPVFDGMRRRDQALLVSLFREGNRRVLVGRDGWLYYRPDVETVVGKGPRYVEPPSVARDPSEGPWQAPLPVIRDFAGQLRKREINLVLVPVPTKAMLEPRGLGADLYQVLPPDYDSVLGEIRSWGVEVVDPAQFLRHGSRGVHKEQLYLKQDTHWLPETMEGTAREVTNHSTFNMFVETEKSPLPRSHRGDLAGMLDLPEERELFEDETVALRRVLDEGGKMLSYADESPVVVLGDSFVNVFDDPALGFGEEGEERIGAGFASHYASEMGASVTVLASNGGGATDTRVRFAEWLATAKRDPHVVVWVLSSRDLFLSERPARRAGIEWRFVDLPEGKREPDVDSAVLVVEATLRERSAVGDPKTTPYASALFSAVFDEVEVVEGAYAKEELFVFLWAFRDRKLLDTAGLKPGDRCRLELRPFPSEGPEATATKLDDLFRADLDRYHAIEADKE